MTSAEYFTYQFYTWEYRGRGWHLSNTPIQLEPPYIPFVRHFQEPPVDDGKHHTLISKIIESFKEPEQLAQENNFSLDYENLEPFSFDDDTDLTAFQIKLPKKRNITPERMKVLLTMLSYNESPISFEIIGNTKEIIIQFVCHKRHSYLVSINLKAYFPEINLVQDDKYLEGIFITDNPVFVTDFGLKEEFVRPLPVLKNFSLDTLTSFFGILENLQEEEQAGLQILFTGVVNSWSESIIHSVILENGKSFFFDSPESPELAYQKINSPLFAVCVRMFAQSKTLNESEELLNNITIPFLKNTNSSCNSLVALPSKNYDIQTRLEDIYRRESHRLGMLLNADELITLLHFPSESIVSNKLYSSRRKTKETPAIALNKPFIIGKNIHNGFEDAVTLSIDDRLKHTHIIGATGTGKSTLIAGMIAQDIEKGLGLMLLDPHGDLVEDVIAHIPLNRLSDVVLIDPSDNDFPIGLNILQAHNDNEKEILSSDLVATFKRFATSWGDQMNAVFSNAVLAILESSTGGTLHDLRRFLVEKEYREKFLQTVKDPSVLYYWYKEFPILKTNSIGPILTRLDTFLRPRSIRNMLIQKDGLDFESLINSNKIILIKLPQGLIGTENSYVLGSLILSKIHQAAFSRQSKIIRNPFFVYIDEFQNFITPSIKELLTGVRKYNVGLILSHQDLQQLQREDSELLNSILGSVYTRIIFRVGEPDAKKLQDGLSYFDSIDLQNLGRGEAIIKIEQPQYDCSLNIEPLQSIAEDTRKRNLDSVVNHSRKLYAKERNEVEELLFEAHSFKPKENNKPKETTERKISIEEKIKPLVSPSIQKEIIEQSSVKENKEKNIQTDISTHRYLQTLVKKMAESRGYIATLEASTDNGLVDILLSKNNKTIGVEICVSTDADWEVYNISKCISADFDEIVSLSGDIKQLEKIKQKCLEAIPDFENKNVQFFTPDKFFSYLGQSENTIKQNNIITTSKGYRINVSYDSVTDEEMGRKKATVAQIVLNSLKRMKKNE